MKCISGKQIHALHIFRGSHPEVFLVKVFLNICSKFTGEHSCRSVISIKLLFNFIEIALRHGCSPVNYYIFSEHLFLGTTLGGCFCIFVTTVLLQSSVFSVCGKFYKIDSRAKIRFWEFGYL